MILNSDGFGDSAKHLVVSEAVREQKLDFVAIIETGRSSFATPFLRALAGGIDFSWYVIPPHGRSGGMLVGFNNVTLVAQNVVTGDFCVKFQVTSKLDGFRWVLVVVYGAAQEAKKMDFWLRWLEFVKMNRCLCWWGEIST